MRELSLNILDIAENSLRAGASLTKICIMETDGMLTLTVEDNGCGMSEQALSSVTDPFYTTGIGKSVGLGIPLLKFAAEKTGGNIEISSVPDNENNKAHGTTVKAVFYKNHIDCTPLGDIISTLITLIQGHPSVDFLFVHRLKDRQVKLDTRELRGVLENISLDNYEVLAWIRENLEEQYDSI